MKMSKSTSPRLRRLATVLALGAGGMLLLSGCTNIDSFIPLPEEQRYQLINQIKDEIDYKDAGEIIEERYYDGGGVLAESGFRLEAKGNGTFKALSDEVLDLPNIECTHESNFQTLCSLKGIYVEVTTDYLTVWDSNIHEFTHPTNPNSPVILSIRDGTNGKGYPQFNYDTIN
jgi:hypothetical protein